MRKTRPPAKQKLSPGSFTPEDIKQLSASAQHTGTPEKVIAALRPATLRVGDITINPISFDTIFQLEVAKSPFLLGGQTSLLDIILTLYILTHTYEEVDAVLDDRAALIAAARAFARRIPAQEVGTISERIKAHLEAGFSTAIATSAGDESEKKTPSAGS